MGFKDLLKEKLKGKIKDINEESLNLLPSGFQRIGNIIILNLKEQLEKHEKEIGESVLEIYPDVKTVCSKKGAITGKFREPQIEVIAGGENTEVVHIENDCKYKFDIRKVMFAKGNVAERVRIAKLVKKDEVIVDMFAGIGYFTIPIGKIGRPEKIYSIELNPVSFGYLKENLKLNHINNRVEAINGDCREEVMKIVGKHGRIADRVVMGYLPPPKDFLGTAFKVIKKGGILHYEDLVVVGKEKEDTDRVIKIIEEAGKAEGFKVKLLLAKKIKSYGPKIDHYVFDVEVR